MRTIHILVILVLLMLALPAAPAQAGGVVTVCDEAHLLAALAGGGTVTFACSGTITLTNTIVIAADTTIDSGGQTVTISGNYAVRVFTVNSGVTLNMNGLRVAHGSASYAQLGGGIFNSGGTVIVNNCSISDNGARFGGGIYNTYPGTMTVISSTISGNHADYGAGIYNDATLLTVADSGITDNVASGSCGGGIYSNRGELIVTNSIFRDNTVDYMGGGGICGYDGAISVSTSTFSGNSGRDAGGAILGNDGASIMVYESTFSGNSASSGGAISSAGILTVTNSTFSGNSAYVGGGIGSHGTAFVSGSTFLGNSSVGQGGGISYGGRYNISLTVSNSTFIGNSAGGEGGGVYSSTSDGVTVSNSTLTGNSAGQQGGGVYSAWSILTLKNTIVANSLMGGNCSGTITDGDGNLSFPDTTCPGINADPKLGPLQDNGGPTETMMLGPGSAAIEAGNDEICAATPVDGLDQRGVTRPQGLHCDIGAVEQNCPNFVPPGTVGVEHIIAIATRWGWTNSTPGWDPVYDLSADNKIDIVDITLLTRMWGGTCS